MLPESPKIKLETNLSLLEIEDVSKKIAKHHSRKYMMPNPFLSLKKKLASLNDQDFSLSNTTRKYFGRKTRQLSNPAEVNSIRNYFKYFKKVHVEEIRGQYSYLAPIEIVIKSLGDLGMLDQPIRVDKTSVRRILSICLCKVSIVSNETANTKWWLSVPMHIKSNIKHLNIPLSKRDHFELLEKINLFQGFNNLESCCIYLIYEDFSQYSSKEPEPPIMDFLCALCQIKTLKSLELDLSRVTISSEALAGLLNEIAIYELPRWYLKALLFTRNREDPIGIDNLKTILNELDFLGLSASRTFVSERHREENVCGYEHNPTDELSNMKHLTRNRKRILDLTFDEGVARDLKLKPLLDNCISLKGLYISSIGSCFKVNKNIGIPKKTARGADDKENSKDENDEVKTWASNLEDVVFSFNNNTNRDDHTVWYLLQVLQEQNHNLRSLEIFSCSSFDNYASDQITEENIDLGREDDIKMQVDDLGLIISLQELKLTSNGQDLHQLNPVLEHLSNLKKFHLVLGVGSKNQDAWDKSFPFKNCGNLQELRITINPDMDSLPWGNDFIKNCHCLQSLQVLEIHDQTKSMSLRIFCSLVKNLMDLKNLRRLIVQTTISSFVSREVPEELEEQFKFSLYALLERLKLQVKNFVDSNRNLEELEIGKLEGFHFKDIVFSSKH